MRNFKPSLGHSIKKGLNYPIGAFDIETHGLYGEYLDGFLKYEDDNTFYRCPTLASLWERITYRKNVILFAHNFKGYESNYLVDIIPASQKIQIILQGDTSVIGFILEFEDGVIEIRDSMALIPMSLKAATSAFKTNAKGDIGLGDDVIYDPTNITHIEYCKNDVVCTIEIVQKFASIQHEIYGCGIGWTAASSAMAAWRTTIPKGKKYYRLSKAQELFCREGYYGGFVYPGRDVHVHHDVISIDRNAAYAAVMRMAYPVGRGRFTTIFEEGKLGMYEVRVHNDGKFPCLPYKDHGSLMWPQGNFTTIVTSEEIEFARKIGIEVNIIEGLVWDTVEYPFLEFIDQCERIEFEEPDKKPVIKLNRNGLYGKFGSKLFVNEACLSDELLEGWIPSVNHDTGLFNFKLWMQEKENNAPYILPHWAAFVTARQRLWLFETIHTVGVEYVYYCDTDSVKAHGPRVRECIEGGLIDMHPHYGGSKVDETYEWFQCLGSKVYHGQLIEGKMKMRAKGIPTRYLSTALFDDAYRLEFENVVFKKGASNGTLVRMKRGLPMQRTIARKMTNRLNSKAWNYHKDGSITPIILN